MFYTNNAIIFPVDASRAGEGQLEISINDGDVPNAVQVLGGGKCLVTYTPEQPIVHEIEVTFNGEQVTGSPFLCRVIDDGDDDDDLLGGGGPGAGPGGIPKGDIDVGMDNIGKVAVELDHLSLVPVNCPANFTIKVGGGDDAELAVSVQGKNCIF